MAAQAVGYALDRRELGLIAVMFDPAAVVHGEPGPGGYVEVTFASLGQAARFTAIARDGDHGAPAFADDVTVAAATPDGPVTLGVVLGAGWRPARPARAIACPYCGRGSGHESWCRLAVAS